MRRAENEKSGPQKEQSKGEQSRTEETVRIKAKGDTLMF